MRRKPLFYFNIVILILVGILIYSNSLSNPFIWDDKSLIEENTFIKNFKYIPKIFITDIFAGSNQKSNFYRPMQSLSYMIEYSIWKLNPTGYHITNTLLHLINAILIYFIISFFLQSRLISFITSLFFLTHPIHTEVVTYISGLADLLAGLYCLLSLFCFIKFRINKKNILYWLSVFSFILALLSKEIALILPILLILINSLFLLNKEESASFRIKFVHHYLTFIVISLVYGLLRISVLSFSQGAFLNIDLPIYLRLLTFSRVFFSYLKMLVLPLNLHMERSIMPAVSFFEPRIFISILSLLLIFIFIFRSYNHHKVVTLGGAWFFINLLPVSGIFPINAFLAEHWLYLPSIGFFIILGYFVKMITEREGLKILCFGFVGFFLIFYSMLTVKQNRIWKNELGFYLYTLKFAPLSARLHYNLGNTYERINQYEKAIEEYKKSIALRMYKALLHERLGVKYQRQKKHNDAAKEFKIASTYKYLTLPSRINLGNTYFKEGKLQEAIDEYRVASEINPYNLEAWSNLGDTYRKTDGFNEAIEAYKTALEIDPKIFKLHLNLGSVYFMDNKYDDAIEEYKIALKLEPNSATVYFNMGLAYVKLNKLNLAKEALEKVIEIDPDSEIAKISLRTLKAKTIP